MMRILSAESVDKAKAGGYFTKRRRRERIEFLFLTAPATLWFGLLMLYPLVRMFYISSLRWHGIVKPSTPIGMENYVRMFSDPRFFEALKHTGIQVVVTLPVVLPLAFMLGFFLSLNPPGYRIFRVIFFTPAILSVAARSMMFVGIYAPNGVINTVLSAIGLEVLTQNWLANTSTVLPAVYAIAFWGGIGFNAVLFFAALSNIPAELYEAAQLDGANQWTMMSRIAFPLSLDFFGVALMLEFTFLLLGFGQVVLLLTGGGPGTATMTLGYMLYEQAFVRKYLGYSQAIGVFIFLLGLIGMMLIRKVTRRSYQYG